MDTYLGPTVSICWVEYSAMKMSISVTVANWVCDDNDALLYSIVTTTTSVQELFPIKKRC